MTEPREERAEVVDLMAALEESIEETIEATESARRHRRAKKSA